MNKQAEIVGLKQTHFDNPHGLCNIYNYSTALDMAILANKCMYIEQFRKVVKTKTYTVHTELRTYEWSNTNKLLGPDQIQKNDLDAGQADDSPVNLFKGTLGCKTGITPTAGPCFAGAFSRTGTYERSTTTTTTTTTPTAGTTTTTTT